jgi:hypothetical protein
MKKGEGEGFTTKDAMAFQERMFGLVEKIKHGSEGEKQDAFAQLNSSLDFIKKVQGAAGIAAGGVKADEDTLGKIAKIAGGIDKGVDYLTARMKKQEQADAAKKKPAGQTTTTTQQPANTQQGIIDFTMQKLLDEVRAGASVPQEHWAESAERVGHVLVSTVLWFDDMHLTDADPEVGFFLAQAKKNPEEILVAFGGKQNPPVPQAYCLMLARNFRLMMGMDELQPAQKAPPTPPAKPQEPPKAPEVVPTAPEPEKPTAEAKGDGGGNGKSHEEDVVEPPVETEEAEPVVDPSKVQATS